MKNILAILLLCLCIDTIQAQKIIEKHLTDASNKKVMMDIQIADSIRIITWNKSEVYVKASVNLNDNKNNENYKTSFDESGSSISIKSKIEFEKGKNCCGTSTNCNCNCNCEGQIYWDVYIPENTDFSVETINGNIVISGKTSDIRAHSISGYVDLTVSPTLKTDLKMNTISGTMYTNFDFSAESKSMKHVGGSTINTQLNGGGGKSIELETISGDIFFRKSE